MKIIPIIVASFLICLCGTDATAQSASSDSLTVEQAVQLTLKSHAAIRQSEYEKAAAAAGIDESRSALYPDISLGGDYTRIGPVPEFEIPGQGQVKLAPDNNYDLHAACGKRCTTSDEPIKPSRSRRRRIRRRPITSIWSNIIWRTEPSASST